MKGHIKDLTGQRFGRLMAIEPTDKRSRGHVVWKCLCDCGNECMIVASHLVSGNTQSCGCKNIRDLTGQRFGRLVAIESIDKRYFGSVVWKCLCDCGNTCIVAASALASGNTQSCGCLNDERRRARRGLLSGNWNPNLTSEQRVTTRHYSGYTKWQKAVYERDDYICQYCGDSASGNLNAHHIESYSNNPSLRITLSNGITLCEEHHRDFHHQYGYGDNTRKQLEKWMNNREMGNDL